MLAKVHSGSLMGIDASPVEVEIDVYPGLPSVAVVGELSLDGRVKPVRGALSMALAARGLQLKGLILPEEDAAEAAVVEGIDILAVPSLLTCAGYLMERIPLEPVKPTPDRSSGADGVHSIDFQEIRGQEYAKRAVEVAAAGGHNVLALWPWFMQRIICEKLSLFRC